MEHRERAFSAVGRGPGHHHSVRRSARATHVLNQVCYRCADRARPLSILLSPYDSLGRQAALSVSPPTVGLTTNH
jgi:hypothetical protein